MTFFFRAEDGIRDRNVTGVQTCALPIFHFDGSDEVDPAKQLLKGGGGAHVREKLVALASRKRVIVIEESKRSEERRVGKECRIRWRMDPPLNASDDSAWRRRRPEWYPVL